MEPTSGDRRRLHLSGDRSELTATLVTGVGGFIGAAVANRLLADGREVVGIDNLNDYYDVRLKEHRLEALRAHKGFTFKKIDIADHEVVSALASTLKNAPIVHLAAQAGVRYSIKEPRAYVASNLVGFANVAELARNAEIGRAHV